MHGPSARVIYLASTFRHSDAALFSQLGAPTLRRFRIRCQRFKSAPVSPSNIPNKIVGSVEMLWRPKVHQSTRVLCCLVFRHVNKANLLSVGNPCE